jgi:hypothetical protein
MHNLKLLDVPLALAGEEKRAFAERLAAAPALARVGDTLRRHADAVLDGEAMVLPEPETGAHLWAPEDAVAVAVLLDAERFYAAVAAVFADDARMVEAIRFQRHVTPARGDRGPRRAAFAHDLAAFRAAPERGLEARAVEVAFTPAAQLAYAPDARSFALTYLGMVRARVAAGEVAVTPPRGRSSSP